MLFQLCHVVLGLRPATRKDEGEIVRGWLHREEAAGFTPGQVCFKNRCITDNARLSACYGGDVIVVYVFGSHCVRLEKLTDNICC